MTETVLLDLKLHYPGRVTIVPFSKPQEARFGADWAWAFVSADGAWSVTMLVQAKRLDDAEQDYRGIRRNIGQQAPPARQIDRLIETSARYGIPPVYAFYNHLSAAARVPAKCGSIPRGTVEQIEAWGISLASAHAVLAHLPNGETFATHCGHSIALHCMLCTRGKGSPGPQGSPGAIADALRQISPGGDPLGSDSGADTFGPSEKLHPIIQLANEMSSSELPDMATAELLSKEFPGVAGVIVLRDAEERHDAGRSRDQAPTLPHDWSFQGGVQDEDEDQADRTSEA